jgi:hypothetical protein
MASIVRSGASLTSLALNLVHPSKASAWTGVVGGAAAIVAGMLYLDVNSGDLGAEVSGNDGSNALGAGMVIGGAALMVGGIRLSKPRDADASNARVEIVPTIIPIADRPRVGLTVNARFQRRPYHSGSDSTTPDGCMPFKSLFVCAVLVITGPAAARAQGAAPSPLEPPGARVAVMDVALYNAQANVQEPSDSEKPALATGVLDSTLTNLLPGQVVDPAEIGKAAGASPGCNVVVACARGAARAADAPWVVLAKVSKTSNLIWLLTAQLVHVPSGTIVLDDTTELKGEPEAMVRAGARIFAERVGRTVRAGGATTNFPA